MGGGQRFCLQFKLVALAYAAANAKELVGEGSYLHLSIAHYALEFVQMSYTCQVDDLYYHQFDNTEMMLLAEVASLCPSGVWAGMVTTFLACEALRLCVKLVYPGDMSERKKNGGTSQDRDTDKHGDVYEDYRWSSVFRPKEGLLASLGMAPTWPRGRQRGVPRRGHFYPILLHAGGTGGCDFGRSFHCKHS